MTPDPVESELKVAKVSIPIENEPKKESSVVESEKQQQDTAVRQVESVKAEEE